MNGADLAAPGPAGRRRDHAWPRGAARWRCRPGATTARPRGTVFIPFAYCEAAANLLTNAALDPFGKIPEFKYCAVRVTGV